MDILKQRRISQITSLLALHSSWGPQMKWLCNPVLSCHSCVLSYFACPIGVLVHFSGYHLFPFLALGMLLLVGALVGRLFCGWVCPFGFLQDMLHKIKSPKFDLPKWTNNIKYLILLFMVFLIPYFLGEETLYSFCRICPAATIQVGLPTYMFGDFTFKTGTFVRLGILAIVLIFAVTSLRSFCKTICPIGALMALTNYMSLWAVKIPENSCVSCKKCDKSCPMDIEPAKRFSEDIPANRHPDCIVCHQCKDGCAVNTYQDVNEI